MLYHGWEGKFAEILATSCQAALKINPRVNKETMMMMIMVMIRYFRKSHNTVYFRGLFALNQWISSSLNYDTIPRVFNLYCFYVKTTQNVLHYGDGKMVN